jgi:hypothetical protein
VKAAVRHATGEPLRLEDVRPALCAAVNVPVATGGLLDGTSRLSLGGSTTSTRRSSGCPPNLSAAA